MSERYFSTCESSTGWSSSVRRVDSRSARHASKSPWASASKRRNGTSSGVRSPAPTPAASSRFRRWKTSITRARASTFGQRSTCRHHPPRSGHTASWKRQAFQQEPGPGPNPLLRHGLPSVGASTVRRSVTVPMGSDFCRIEIACGFRDRWPNLVPVAQGITDLLARETQDYVETTRRPHQCPPATPAS